MTIEELQAAMAKKISNARFHRIQNRIPEDAPLYIYLGFEQQDAWNAMVYRTAHFFDGRGAGQVVPREFMQAKVIFVQDYPSHLEVSI